MYLTGRKVPQLVSIMLNYVIGFRLDALFNDIELSILRYIKKVSG